MTAPLRDISGQRFGRLTALEFAGYKQYTRERKRMWKCRCDCGKEVTVAYMYLTGGGTKSCGCLVGQHKRTHGATIGGKMSPEFRVWSAMHSRCENPRNKGYKDYGGRGIKVCERWASFENFLADMGPRPSLAHSIDRYPNNDGDYEPHNCRWATMREQSNNRRSSRTLTFHDETLTLAEWERRAGLSSGVLHRRLHWGWTVEEALTVENGRKVRRESRGEDRRRSVVSERELAVLDFIRSELAAGRPAPRQRDIAKAFGFASKNAAVNHLKRLARHGFIQLVPRSEGRIRVTNGSV